ncbi:response regulator [Flagellimonas meridianipacifica]|uniref:CheY-like chemotaxis protein n=1 Tax=Flagellimonas meridianipacifica TaxID=1080225 RepID=A0A2T0MI12_9FLAO|nr:response regulator [Allomuricauda pacifica]PRX57185.1 CheY-like chemotaxis protein [Allomuricauda pacifica]
MPLTICIIDDDLVSQFATRYCVQQFFKDFDIVTCDSGEEGLSFCSQYFEENNKLPDIIFLDLVMAGIDGWTFLELLKQQHRNKKLPKVYVLSAFAKSSDREIAKAHPLISGYFDKPLSRIHLQGIFVNEK